MAASNRAASKTVDLARGTARVGWAVSLSLRRILKRAGDPRWTETDCWPLVFNGTPKKSWHPRDNGRSDCLGKSTGKVLAAFGT